MGVGSWGRDVEGRTKGMVGMEDVRIMGLMEGDGRTMVEDEGEGRSGRSEELQDGGACCRDCSEDEDDAPVLGLLIVGTLWSGTMDDAGLPVLYLARGTSNTLSMDAESIVGRTPMLLKLKES